MRNYKQFLSIFLIGAAILFFSTSYANNKSKDEKKSEYEKLFSKEDKSANGLMNLHLADGKVYFEIPDSLFGREFLLGSTISSTSDNRNGVVGRKNNDLIHFTLSKEGDKIAMRIVDNLNIIEGVKRAKGAIFNLYKIECTNPETKAAVIDVTDLFLSNHKLLSPFYEHSQHATTSKRSESFVKKNSYIKDIKSFSDNVSVSSVLSYTFTLADKGIKYRDVPFTATVLRTILLLPKKANQPRYIDSRVAIFPLEKNLFSDRYQGSRKIYYANKWSVIPKDIQAYKRGELVEPEKQIIFYIDPAFPSKYRSYIKEGVEQWNQVFAQIGFKNVLKALDYPKNDPEFDPDNLKYSTVRYAPIAIQNAEGPSWLDPRNGEIINATVHIYHDAFELINKWLFVQTSQVDKRVRKVIIDEEVIGDALRYVVAHEVGHCLGFMHNMGASASFPVDSLRSTSFTQKYGTTPSIMDYTRFNYVAQVEDSLKNLYLAPPRFGEYDQFLVKYNYSYIDSQSPEKEYEILSRWLKEAAENPILRFGKQQFGVLDPRSQSEDLGDDAIKASEYGIKNLKYIIQNMDEWLGEQDPDYIHRKMIYTEIIQQYIRYISHVYNSVGGVNLYEKHVGDNIDNYKVVPTEYQKRALNFVLNSLDDIDWLYPVQTTKYYIDNPYKDVVLETIFEMVMDAPSRCDFAATISKEPFTALESMDIIFDRVWGALEAGKALTVNQMKMQNLYLLNMSSAAGLEEFSTGEKSISAYEEQAALYNEKSILPGDNLSYILRAKKLLEKGVKSRDKRTKAHCVNLLFRLEKEL